MKSTRTFDRGKLGRQKFCRFCHVIAFLLRKRKERFDLIITAGNTGIAMGKFTAMISEALGLRPPKQVNLPFFRFLPGHEEDVAKLADYKIFLPLVIARAKEVGRVQSVLFVDDEIGRGLTAVACFKLLNAAIQKLGKPKMKRFLIVTEDHGFALPPDLPEMVFIPYDTKTPGFNNAIFFIEKFEKPISRVLGGDTKFPWKARTNLLLGLPVKQYAAGKPVFSDRPLTLVTKRVKNFEKIQKRYQNYVRSLIRGCLRRRAAFPIVPKRRLGYTFRKAKEADLPLFERWLEQNFVAARWRDRWKKEEWLKRLHSKIISPYLVSYGKKPIGYIEVFRGGSGQSEQRTKGGWRIKTFIGNEWFLGKGHEEAFRKAFILSQSPRRRRTWRRRLGAPSRTP